MRPCPLKMLILTVHISSGSLSYFKEERRKRSEFNQVHLYNSFLESFIHLYISLSLYCIENLLTLPTTGHFSGLVRYFKLVVQYTFRKETLHAHKLRQREVNVQIINTVISFLDALET